jgi:hypothetical protein
MKTYFTLFAALFVLSLPLSAQFNLRNFTLNEIRDGDEEFKKKRMEWIESLHSCEPGVNRHIIDAETRQAKQQFKQEKLKNLNQIQSDLIANGRIKGQWIEKGSNNLAGRIRISDIDFERKLIYAGSDGGNIWRGTIDGKNWTCLSNTMRLNDIRLVKILKFNNKNRILVVGNVPSNVYFSDNEGQNWNKSTGLEAATATGNIKRTIVVPSQPAKLFILGNEWDYDRSVQISVIYLSVDNGQSFTKIFKSDVDISKCDIWTPKFETGKIFLLQKDTLSEINSDNTVSLINTLSISQNFDNVSSMYIKGKDNNNLTILAYDLSQSASLFYSTQNGGMNWESRGSLPFSPWETNTFEVSALDPDLMFCGQCDLYRSYDGGRNWEIINSWVDYYGNMYGKLHADIPSVCCFKDPDNNEIMTICTDGGLYISYDQTQTVRNLSQKGLGVSQYYSSYTCRYNTDAIYIGSQDQGFQRCLKDSGASLSFEQTMSGDYGHLTSSDGGSNLWCVYPGFAWLYQGLDNQNIQNSAIWNFKGSDWLWMPPIIADPINPEAAYMASGGFNGSSQLWHLEWSNGMINSTLLPYDFNSDNDNTKVSSFAYSRLDHNYFYALTTNGKFFVSSDRGNNWIESPDFKGPEPHYFYGNCLLPSKSVFGRVFMSGSGYSNPGVYMTDDNGQTFKPLITGLPNTLVFNIAMDSEERFIFAATEVGPYIYSFADSTWFDMSVGDCPDQVFWEVDYIPEIETARFVTYGRGVWDFKVEEFTTVSEQSKNSDASAGIQINVIPNPVSDNSTISFDLPTTGFTTVKIYDIQGRIVGSLFNGIMEAGNHEFNWTGTTVNGTRLPQGDYMCVVAAYGRSWFAKIKLVR